jgi:hypothetical protein
MIKDVHIPLYSGMPNFMYAPLANSAEGFPAFSDANIGDIVGVFALANGDFESVSLHRHRLIIKSSKNNVHLYGLADVNPQLLTINVLNAFQELCDASFKAQWKIPYANAHVPTWTTPRDFYVFKDITVVCSPEKTPRETQRHTFAYEHNRAKTQSGHAHITHATRLNGYLDVLKNILQEKYTDYAHSECDFFFNSEPKAYE